MAIGGPVLVIALKALWAAFVILTPVLGAWLSSSLAAFGGGPVWLAAMVGVLLFPVLPGAWEGFAEWRYRKQKTPTPHILTRGDRVLLRTLGLNLLFLFVLLAARPQTAFEALATRGDWMLDGSTGPTAQRVRAFLFGAAEKLAWLYEATDDDPYEDEHVKKDDNGNTVVPLPRADTERVDDPSRPAEPDRPVPKPPEPPIEPTRAFDRGKPWPSAATPHPLVATMPAEAQSSIDALAKYAVANEPDPMSRFKLLHDWVAVHVAYDVAMLRAPRITQQDAETVFASKKGVCAGYSLLLEQLGKKAGYEIHYVSGHARASGDDVDGERHAWNVVTIEGTQYLIDATWDAGFVGPVEGGTELVFTRSYSADYLFTPPEVFLLKHFPTDSKWQLLDKPVSRGEFLRRPVLSPEFFAVGLKLISPDRSQVTAQGSLELVVERSNEDTWLLASVIADGARTRCDVARTSRFDIRCTFPAEGKYEVMLFYSPKQYSTYESVGSISVINDP